MLRIGETLPIAGLVITDTPPGQLFQQELRDIAAAVEA
jgi:hypothetical protein